MHTLDHDTTVRWNRRQILLVILITIFVGETGAMCLLPMLLPSDTHPWIEALTDATVLSLGSVFPLWFLLLRPMYGSMRRRSHQARLLMEALDEHALVSISDAHGRINYANDSLCRISKYSREELLGKEHSLVTSAYHPESFTKDMWDTLESGESWHGETCSLAKDGSRYWVDMTIVPCKDMAGRITQYVALRQVITGRKRAEHELRKLSVAVEQSPVSVVITDTKGTIEYVNPRFTETTGYTADEVIGQNPRILKSGTLTAEAYRQMWETISVGKVWRGEFCNKKKNGELYWESASIAPARDDLGNVTHYLAVKEDITERKRAEESLAEARRAIEQEAQKLRSLIEGMNEGVIVSDADDILTEVNTWFLAKTELCRDDVVGKPLWDFHPDPKDQRQNK